jgi:hypothetical protein
MRAALGAIRRGIETGAFRLFAFGELDDVPSVHSGMTHSRLHGQRVPFCQLSQQLFDYPKAGL